MNRIRIINMYVAENFRYTGLLVQYNTVARENGIALPNPCIPRQGLKCTAISGSELPEALCTKDGNSLSCILAVNLLNAHQHYKEDEELPQCTCLSHLYV